MNNFRNLAMVGVMFVSTTSCAIAAEPICCPTVVPVDACRTGGNQTACYLKDCVETTCKAGTPTDYTWMVLNVTNSQEETSLTGATSRILVSMFLCDYTSPDGAKESLIHHLDFTEEEGNFFCGIF